MDMDLESKKLLGDIKTAFEGHNDTIIKTIEVTVNGKIDKLTNNFNQWKEHETNERELVKERLDEYILKTEEYRKTTEPMIEFFNNMTGAKKVLFWGLGIFASIGGAILMGKEIFK